MTLLYDSPLTLQYIYKAYGLIELDRYLNSRFTRPPKQPWLLLYSWFSKLLAHLIYESSMRLQKSSVKEQSRPTKIPQ